MPTADDGGAAAATDGAERPATRKTTPPLTTATTISAASPRVLYFVDESTTAIAYAEGHVMRPSRVRVLHSLVRSLGLDAHMTICQPHPATPQDLRGFHCSAYVECLQKAPVICGNPLDAVSLSYQKAFAVPVYSRDGDCPLFPEVWKMVASQAGASIACGEALCRGEADVAINWAGGMHHAAASRASGFCFVNDIVLCIHRLLRRFQRVLYLDLDVHHGDGVEAAFYGNARVMTVSLHQFGNGFFPGTGNYGGPETAGSFAVNVPLTARTGDATYCLFFRTVLTAVVRCFDPEAAVLQCGADAIVGDLIGRLNVTTAAHAQCLAEVLRLRLPTVLLGGGGYHVFNTARCWAIDTATALGRLLPCYVPRHDPYYEEYRRECAPHRPRMHVCLDPEVDRPLTLHSAWGEWRKLCQSLQAQMRYARLVRESFLRAVAESTAKRCRETVDISAGEERDEA
ncbi:putative histone deacetylase [Trypanosoma conorhini]|uniref:histone deacetylase n=1 Tax=Trypanosoma conorhini TaxID=83891 RepID=A0A422MXT4_9TRYP|nr:putative histone deacetylase [Trypanosoma conorhini]RNE98042.1 putative histone deacetylase [Trypanosoma conorhini]